MGTGHLTSQGNPSLNPELPSSMRLASEYALVATCLCHALDTADTHVMPGLAFYVGDRYLILDPCVAQRALCPVSYLPGSW